MKILKAILCIIIILYLYCIINVEKYTVKKDEFYYVGTLTDPKKDSKPCKKAKQQISNLTCFRNTTGTKRYVYTKSQNDGRGGLFYLIMGEDSSLLWKGMTPSGQTEERIKVGYDGIHYVINGRNIELKCGNLKLTYEDILYVHCMKPTGNLFLEDSIYIFLKTKYYTNQKRAPPVQGPGSIKMKPHAYTEHIFESGGEGERIMKKIYWVQPEGDKLRLHYESEVVTTLKTRKESVADVTAAVAQAKIASTNKKQNLVSNAESRVATAAKRHANTEFTKRLKKYNKVLKENAHAIFKILKSENSELNSMRKILGVATSSCTSGKNNGMCTGWLGGVGIPSDIVVQIPSRKEGDTIFFHQSDNSDSFIGADCVGSDRERTGCNQQEKATDKYQCKRWGGGAGRRKYWKCIPPRRQAKQGGTQYGCYCKFDPSKALLK
jgi:hypothetical protein